ncbi:MAG: PfaD family polyunsaturated fatty acid/polyketide biosynthesis protein [Polyangiales bacterium]
MPNDAPNAMGSWSAGEEPARFDDEALVAACERARESVHVVRDGDDGAIGVAFGGTATPGGNGRVRWLATLPAIYPEWLGDRSFNEVHRVRFPYIAGEMANGIATPALVVAMARGGMLGFYGAAGLSFERVSQGLDEIERALAGTNLPWGANLIHSPNEPDLEHRVATMFLERGVERVCCSAYMALTKSVVKYAVAGLALDASGALVRNTHVFAKISRPEVAKHFLAPAPRDMVSALVAAGELTELQAELSARVPIAEDITVEADSGGHTDNRPLVAMLPTIQRLVLEMSREHRYARPIRVGAAGGLGVPSSVAAAFSLGAAYVLTGSVNQSAVEAGLSVAAKKMLAIAGIADVVMAPAADMFELGVNVQVLRRGTMFAVRGKKLYELYQSHKSMEDIPASDRATIEAQIFKMPLEAVWEECRKFFSKRDPREIERAEREPKHRMALVFRWYLGKASRWAIDGDTDRTLDYQVWCGPAMGAFNEWVRGTFLEAPENRSAVQIARNLLEGAAAVTRAQQLRTFGAPMPASAFEWRARPLDE